jgi:hypothetical protein
MNQPPVNVSSAFQIRSICLHQEARRRGRDDLSGIRCCSLGRPLEAYAHFMHSVLIALPGLLAGLVGALGGRLRRERTERALDAGWLTCALKVTSGRQQGLSGRWRHVLAGISPGSLDCRGLWYRPGQIGNLQLTGVRGPARPPARMERFALSADCRIVQVQTPTATLSWAILDRHVEWTLTRILARGDVPSVNLWG